jgi:hypothetical protein
MPQCRNPTCSRRSRNVFTQAGFTRHLGAKKECKAYFESAKIRVQSTDKDRIFPSCHNASNHSCHPAVPTVHFRENSNEVVVDSDHLDVPMEDDDEVPMQTLPDEDSVHGVTVPPSSISEHGFEDNAPRKPPNVYDYNANNAFTSREWVEQWYRWSEYENSKTGGTLPHPSNLKDDLSLLENLLSDPNYLPGWNRVPDSEMAELDIMNRLNQIKGCPLFVYDQVISWAKEWLYHPDELHSRANVILRSLRSREELVNASVKFAHTQNTIPVTSKIKLPRCRKKVDITRVSYLGNLYGILTDEMLVNDDTLLLNGETPYDNPTLPMAEDQINDFNHGTKYINAWNNMKVDPIDLPFGDVFFVDKTVYDCNDRLTGEPIMHTNSLINCDARNQASAWNSLGSVPTQRCQGHSYASDKIFDYHHCLSFILSEYECIQTEKSGILWPLSFRGKMFMVRLRPYVLAVLGDTPGQNAMTAKVSGTKKLCRYCNVTKESLSDPWAKYRLMTLEWQKEIQRTETARKREAYYHIDVVWNRLNFGGDPGGIHNSVPAEILHMYQKGFYIRLHECLVTVPSLGAQARKDNRNTVELNGLEEAARKRKKYTTIARKNKNAKKVDKQNDLIKREVFLEVTSVRRWTSSLEKSGCSYKDRVTVTYVGLISQRE